MNVEIRTEDAQFPEKEYINVIFVAVHDIMDVSHFCTLYKHDFILALHCM